MKIHYFYELQSFEKTEDNLVNIALKIKLRNLDSLDIINKKINDKFTNSSLIFFNSPES